MEIKEQEQETVLEPANSEAVENAVPEQANVAVEEASAEAAPAAPVAEAASEAAPAATKFCAGCGAELSMDQAFCPKCGREQQVAAAPAVEPVPEMDPEKIAEFNRQLEEKKKKNKKKMMTILIAVVAVIVLVVGGKFAISAIMHSSGMSKIDSAVEDYKNEKIDYDEAIAVLAKQKESKDEEVADHAVQAEKTVESLKVSFDHFEKAETYKAKKQYLSAIQHYEKVIKDDPHYDEAQKSIEAIIPEWKKVIPASLDKLLKDDKIDDADTLVKTFLGYSKDDEEIGNLGKFVEAESLYKKGHLNGAKDIYSKLPKTLKLNGVTVQSRLDTLKKYDVFVKMCGKWQTTKYYYETKETARRSGSWNSWYVDETELVDRYLECTCIINADGTVTVKGTLDYATYTNYSDYQSSLKQSVFYTDFSKKCTLPSDGKVTISYVDDDVTYSGTTLLENNTVTFNGKVFTFNNKSGYVSSYYWRYDWKCDVTFGKCVKKY